MSIADKLTYLNGTKEAIKQAITDKGVEVSNADTFRSYADKIASITTGNGTVDIEGTWHPNPYWWDIESILQNDTRDYAGKFIALIFNIDDDITLNLSSNANNGCVAIATSDGAFYTYNENGSTVVHTWDKTQDKPVTDNDGEQLCTRYVIYYYNTTLVSNIFIKLPANNVYIIFGLSITGGHIFLKNNLYLQCFEFSDNFSFVNITDFTSFCYECPALVKLPKNLDVSNGTRFYAFCSGCTSLSELPENFDVSNGTNFTLFCYKAKCITKLPKILDVSNGTEFSNFGYGMESLLVANIKLPSTSITTLSNSSSILKSSLQYIANNAPDVTDLDIPPTLTLGSSNIARAGGADGEIIQTLVNKGWTVN